MAIISIIMGVFNNEKTLNQAIDSILDQTFKDWEFIICDDASTDNSYNILLEYKKRFPDKFIILKNDNNLKLAASLNKCLSISSGKYIARMDGDDISLSDRLEKQFIFLEENKEYDLVGTLMQSFDDNGLHHVVKIKNEPVKEDLPVFNPFHHATIMARNNVYKSLNGYTVSKKTSRMEDVDLWYRFYAHGFKGFNYQEVLYLVREDKNAYKRRKLIYYIHASIIVFKGVKLLNLPLYYYIYSIKPILAWILPYRFKILWRKKFFKNN